MTAQKRNRPLALGYIRVSTADQAKDGASLPAQRSALISDAERRGWDIEIVADEGLSGKNLKRPALQGALTRLDEGEADILLAVRLDRVSRSVADFAGLLDRSIKKRWALVLQSPNIDTSDPAGEFTANVLASAAQYERRLISVRTREGMAQRKSEGTRMGRPRTLPEEVVDRIAVARANGLSLSKIAEALNTDGIPTSQGGARWYPATISKILNSHRTPGPDPVAPWL
jgi:DNA invertase Pin-like site-specific DNA recombinase